MSAKKNDEFAVVPAIRVRQPLGDFYAVVLNADILGEVAYSIPAIAIREDDSAGYKPGGTQRDLKKTRLQEIGEFIDTIEATFPNTIILGANYDNKTGELVQDEKVKWYISQEAGEFYYLHIPTNHRLASLIDGQHRLKGFDFAEKNKAMPLLCAVFLDLPFPYHAYIFATINYNQKSVSKSLAYDLFGFDLNDEPSESWAPEMLAVYLTRILESEPDSPLNNHVKIGVSDSANKTTHDNGWKVSLATIVDGIMSLLSSSPKKDRDIMHKMPLHDGRLRTLLSKQPDRPLREFYLSNNDAAIYLVLKNYFTAVDELMWRLASDRSYITKTVGIQALFDVLRVLLNSYEKIEKENTSVEHFKLVLTEAAKINFDGPYFEASGIGKGLIRNLIVISCALQPLTSVRGDENQEKITRILNDSDVQITL